MDDEIEVKQKLFEEGGETTIKNDYREYSLKGDEKNNYILGLELKEKYIYFVVSSENQINYNYKTFMDLPTIVNKLELNQPKYNKLELILKIFEQLYENNKISLKINNNEYCNLILNFVNESKENSFEIKIDKNYDINIEHKLGVIFNLMRSLKNNYTDNNNNELIKKMKNQINILNEKIEQKDKTIKEMNKKIINKENKIKELEEKIVNLNNDYNNAQEKIKKLNNLNNITNNGDKTYFDNTKDEYPQETNKEIDINMEEFINKKYFPKNIYKDGVRNFNFTYPKNLRFKCNITTTNTPIGWNDLLAIFISSIDNKEFLFLQIPIIFI